MFLTVMEGRQPSSCHPNSTPLAAALCTGMENAALHLSCVNTCAEQAAVSDLVQDAQADSARRVDVWVKEVRFELALDVQPSTSQ